MKRFEGAQDPVIIADRDVSRFGVTEHVTKLANTSGFKVVTSQSLGHCHGVILTPPSLGYVMLSGSGAND